MKKCNYSDPRPCCHNMKASTDVLSWHSDVHDVNLYIRRNLVFSFIRKLFLITLKFQQGSTESQNCQVYMCLKFWILLACYSKHVQLIRCFLRLISASLLVSPYEHLVTVTVQLCHLMIKLKYFSKRVCGCGSAADHSGGANRQMICLAHKQNVKCASPWSQHRAGCRDSWSPSLLVA